MSELNHKMNRYKAMNLAKNEEIRFSKNVNSFKIEKKKLSSGLICWLFKNYQLDEWITDNHCCRGEDFCCWQEAHSSWMSLVYHSDKVLQQEIYKIFCDSTNFLEKKACSTIIKSKRKLTEEQVLMILVNFEYKIIPIAEMAKRVGVASTYTLFCIKEGKSYQDYAIKYNKLTEEQKDKLASLLRN